jgi:hypothetical protein
MAFTGFNTDETPIIPFSDPDGFLFTEVIPTLTNDKLTGSVYFSYPEGVDSEGFLGAFIIQQCDEVENWDPLNPHERYEALENYTYNTLNPDNPGAPWRSIDPNTPVGFSEELVLPHVRIIFQAQQAYDGEGDPVWPSTLKIFGRTANSGVKY